MRKGSENLSILKIFAEKLCDLQDDGADYSFSCRVRGRNAIPTKQTDTQSLLSPDLSC